MLPTYISIIPHIQMGRQTISEVAQVLIVAILVE